MTDILIVDDDKLIRDGLVDLLDSEQYHVETAENGKAGLDKALKLHPRLIVSDVKMPEMTGPEMIEALRKDQDWGKNVPVIILTNDETADTINDTLTAGVTVYLSKTTAQPTEIVEQIKSALGPAAA